MSHHQPASGTGQKDSLIGICAAIGDDLGFHPDILRVALAGGLLFAPAIVVGLYAGMGIVVLASRLLFPPRRRAPAAQAAIVPSPSVETATEPRPERLLEAA